MDPPSFLTKRPPAFRPITTSSPASSSRPSSPAPMMNTPNLHVATPAKQAKRFGGMAGMFASNSRREAEGGASRPGTPSGARDAVAPADKKPAIRVRAGVTPDAKSRALYKANGAVKVHASGASHESAAQVYDPEEVLGTPPPPVPRIPNAFGQGRTTPSPSGASSIRLVTGSSTSSFGETAPSARGPYGALHALSVGTSADMEGYRAGYDEPVAAAARGQRVVSAAQELELGDDGEEVGFSGEWMDGGRVGAKANETVLVTVRVRPVSQSTAVNQAEAANAWDIAEEGDGGYGGRSIRLADGTRKEWVFDRVLPPASTNAQTYATAARPHIHAAMSGYNAVVFAYGQTASGKTFTLSGTPSDPGVIPRAVEDVFRFIKGLDGRGREWVLRASYLELYNENLCDLLAPPGSDAAGITILNGKKDGEVQIHGLTEVVVTSVAEVGRVLEMGEKRRSTGVTDWNERSSRSHSVFRIVIESRLKSDDTERTPARGKSSKATRISCLSLIDLAGSEKATGSKERNAEGKYINQSLLTLKNVISKLAEQSAKKTSGHVPFRDSKLTRLLQPSLSGDARISVICTINPSAGAITESQSTLGFAAGVKRVVLNATKTEVVDPAALIQQYQSEIAELKAKLAQKDAMIQTDGLNRRMTVSERQERNNFANRLTELKRLILTSTTLEEEDEALAAAPHSPSKINHGKSTFELQEQLHIANTKLQEQANLVQQLQRDLALRPTNPNQRCQELQIQVEQLTEMNKEYESNLNEPGQKVREDVEAEWVPKVQALEARAREKELFYKELYDDVHRLKAENGRLKERCERLEADKQQFILAFKELDENTVESPPRNYGRSSHTRTQSAYENKHAGGLRPLGESNRVTSVSVAKLNSALANKPLGKMGLGKGLRDDSLFDLAARAAYVGREDIEEEIF